MTVTKETLSGSSSEASRTSGSLIQRARARDAEAWRQLVELYGGAVYSWCRQSRLAHEDIADIFQEVFHTVAQKLGSFRKEKPSDTFRGWLRTITRNKINDLYRKRGREPSAHGGSEIRRFFDALTTGDESDPSAPAFDERRALFINAVQQVRAASHDRTWQAFWRVVVDEQNATAVAEELGMTPGAVRVSKSRVLQRLRELLDDTAW